VLAPAAGEATIAALVETFEPSRQDLRAAG
jgi:hypothetical protein